MNWHKRSADSSGRPSNKSVNSFLNYARRRQPSTTARTARDYWLHLALESMISLVRHETARASYRTNSLTLHTEFTFETKEEEDELRMRPSSQHTPGYSYPGNLHERLQPHRVGIVMRTRRRQSEETRSNPLTPLTLNMLRWHDNPSTGIYIAINNQVWDVTGKLNPGFLFWLENLTLTSTNATR